MLSGYSIAQKTGRCGGCMAFSYVIGVLNSDGLCASCAGDNDEDNALVRQILEKADDGIVFSRAEYLRAIRHLWHLLNPSLKS